MRRLKSWILRGVVVLLGVPFALAQAPTWAADGDGRFEGYVLNRDGQPVIDALVVVFAKPGAPARRSAGDRIALERIGSTRTDGQGHYDIVPTSSTAIEESADSAGIATFNVSVIDGDRSQSKPAQARIRIGGSDAAEFTPISPDRSKRSSTSAVAVDFELAEVNRSRTPAREGGPSRTDAATSSVVVVEDYGPRNVFVGQFASFVPDVTHTFTYSTNSETALGWAVSSSGEAGSSEFGGTQTKSANKAVSIDSSGVVFDKYRTQYVFQQLFYQTCAGGGVCFNEWRIEPVSYAGGIEAYESDIPFPRRCVPQGPSSTFVTKDDEGYTFDYGVGILNMTSVELSSKSNFSTSVKQEIRFPTGGFTCGWKDYPGGDPEVISADTVDEGGRGGESQDFASRREFERRRP